jgi:hypothetical protein
MEETGVLENLTLLSLVLPDFEPGHNFDEPWDGPNNRKLLDKMPAVYGYPGADDGPKSSSHCAYFVLTGEGTALAPPVATAGQGVAEATHPGPTGRFIAPAVRAVPTLADFTDGVSNTILIVEAKREIPWTKPEDIPFNLNGPLPELGGFSPDGFNAAFADGAVRFISKSIDPTVFKALITRAGGEAIHFPR